MTHLQLTPDDPAPGTPDDPDLPPRMDAPGEEGDQEMRLERDEVARAADEGMVDAAPEDVALTPPQDVAPLQADAPAAHPGFEESR